MAHKKVSNDESHYTVWSVWISVAVRVRDTVRVYFILQSLAPPHSRTIGAGFETSALDSTPCTPLFQNSGENTENLAPPGTHLLIRARNPGKN